ncbi:MAG: CRTAC1 family protein [Roseibacillus sp.]
MKTHSCLPLFATSLLLSTIVTVGEIADPALLIEKIVSLEAEAFENESEAREIELEGIVPLWDSLLQAPLGKRLELLAAVPFDTLTLGKAGAPTRHDLGITTRQITSGGETLSCEGFAEILQSYRQAGYSLVHSDWHHRSFQRNEAEKAISEVTFNLQGSRKEGTERLQFKGTLRIVWDESEEKLRPSTITLLEATSAQRRGPAAFTTRAVIEGGNPNPTERDDMGAISVYDLNGDQLPEIILGNSNKILWNKGNFQFEPQPIVDPGGLFFDSVIGLTADLNGDGLLDWLSDTKEGDLALWFGEEGGKFAKVPRRIKLGDYRLRVPSFITAGDCDQDGDLDLYVGQWRSLYEKMPDTFWDANDGFGNTLLINDGTGTFEDRTEASGLAQKRYRRAYSGSFLDLDQDEDLDLLVISDFHGVDVYLNNGQGKFSEQEDSYVGNPYSFGMSHTVADYDADGLLDFYVLGMGSTTARRLDQMKANPEQHPEHNKMRGVMGFGNRMYLGRKEGGYKAPEFEPQVARTGWTWGSASADFDNDGDHDIYAANGHISGKTSRDYCSNFWCRDVYVMKDFKLPAISGYLETLPQMEEQSWDGFQINPLLINQDGIGFQDFGFLLDIGFDFDCRRVIAADLDLDGRVDLAVGRIEGTSGFFHDGETDVEPPALLIMQNTLPEAEKRPWIGVTLETSKESSPNGAKLSLKTNQRVIESVIVSGDSFMCQHPAQKHFGLANDEEVETITVHWPGGQIAILEKPKIQHYHPVTPITP